MARTNIRGTQIRDNTVQRADIDITTVGQSLITKVIAGTGVTIASTGADSGTGDVTINTSLSTTVNWQTWTPTYGASPGDSYTTVTTNHAQYFTIGDVCFFSMNATGTTSGSPLYLTFTLPVTPYLTTVIFICSAGINSGAGTLNETGVAIYSGSGSTMIVRRYDARAWTNGSGRQFAVEGFYRI